LQARGAPNADFPDQHVAGEAANSCAYSAEDPLRSRENAGVTRGEFAHVDEVVKEPAEEKVEHVIHAKVAHSYEQDVPVL
jgi:hypothetical protein